jgi:hypothetical protein
MSAEKTKNVGGRVPRSSQELFGLPMCSRRLSLRLSVSAGKPISTYGAGLKTSVLFTSTLPNCMG